MSSNNQSTDSRIITIIVATDSAGGIGLMNDLPWRCQGDMKFFRKTTWGKHVIMGRKTFESIKKVLPGRTTIVMTRDKDWVHEECLVAHSLEEALSLAKGDEIMIAGGADIYGIFLPLADIIYMTRVMSRYECDTFFPDLNEDEWICEPVFDGAFQRCHATDDFHTALFYKYRRIK